MSGDIESQWPNLHALIDCGGQIDVGFVHPVRCAAVASDEVNMLAALKRQDGESLEELLQRLDAAVYNALEYDAFVNEIG